MPKASSPLAARARAPGDVIQQPFQFGGGKIGVEQQAGARGDHGGVARIGQCFAGVRRAPVLPDDGAVQGLARGAVPQQGGFALVGDTDGTDLGWRQAGAFDGGARGTCDGGPQISGVMFDPAGLGVVLGEFLLSRGNHAQGSVKDNGAAGGGALINGKDMGHCASVGQGLDQEFSENSWQNPFEGFWLGRAFVYPPQPVTLLPGLDQLVIRDGHALRIFVFQLGNGCARCVKPDLRILRFVQQRADGPLHA